MSISTIPAANTFPWSSETETPTPEAHLLGLVALDHTELPDQYGVPDGHGFVIDGITYQDSVLATKAAIAAVHAIHDTPEQG